MPSEEKNVTEIGGHSILEKLARGRAGTIYKAKGPDGGAVALRVLGQPRSELTGPAKGQERLEDVYKKLRKLQHPNVPRVTDVRIVDEDQPFALVELVQGERLDRILEEQRLPIELVAKLGKTLAEALAAAHQIGLVHTDVCARSVLVGRDGRFHLLGWSAARATGAPLGKDLPRASVRPPDGEGAEDAAHAGLDVFGLGALLYETVAFAPPRPEDPRAAPLLRTAWPPRRLNPTVPPALEAIIVKAIDPARERRYASANDLAQDLAAFLDGTRPKARPAGLAHRLRTHARKHAAGGAGIAIALALVLGGGLANVVAARLRANRVASELAASRRALEAGALEEALAALDRARREDADPDARAILVANHELEEKRLALRANAALERARTARDEALVAAKAALARAAERRAAIPLLEEALRQAAGRARPLDPLDGPEKEAVQAARDALEAAAIDEARALGDAHAALRRALVATAGDDALDARGIEDELARVQLARARACDAERDPERELRARSQRTARTLLTGGGTTQPGELPPALVTIEVEPDQATVFVRHAEGTPDPPAGVVGPTALRLAAGEDATLVVQKPGYATAEVPVRLEAGIAQRIMVRLVPDDRVPRGFVAIPAIALRLPPPPVALAGASVDRAATATVHAVAPPVVVGPALVAQRPVTRGEYAAFLRALPAADLADHLPRGAAGIDALARDAQAPVTGVPLAAARAYARSKSLRLPRRAELWAAVARGASCDLAEWVDDPVPGSREGDELPGLVLDVRAGSDRELVPEDRFQDPRTGSSVVTFRVARDGPEPR